MLSVTRARVFQQQKNVYRHSVEPINLLINIIYMQKRRLIDKQFCYS